jgi:hypothetical protein
LGYFYWYFNQPEHYNVVALIIVSAIGAGIFSLKALAIIYVQMWIRWTLPRPRIDQVLYACVKVLLPLACVLLLGAAIWQWLVPERPMPVTPDSPPAAYNPWIYGNPWNFAQWWNEGFRGALVTQVLLTLIGVTGFTVTVAWIGYAFISGRDIKQRLTEPAAIDEAPEPLPA